MDLNINNLVRSGVILVLGLPVTVGVLMNVTSSNSTTRAVQVQRNLEGRLMEPCFRYAFSKGDSKLERDAKNEIDDIVGGEVAYGETCKWVFS